MAAPRDEKQIEPSQMCHESSLSEVEHSEDTDRKEDNSVDDSDDTDRIANNSVVVRLEVDT